VGLSIVAVLRMADDKKKQARSTPTPGGSSQVRHSNPKRGTSDGVEYRLCGAVVRHVALLSLHCAVLGLSCFQPASLIHLELPSSTSNDTQWRFSFSTSALHFSNSVGSEGSDPCVHPCAMKQSPVGELAMGRGQLRGCSQSLLMQEVRRCELSPGFSPNTGQRTR
jgi:hypothetical protein